MLIYAAGDVWRRVLLGHYCRERFRLNTTWSWMYIHPRSAIWMTHLVQVKVQLDEASRARVRCARAKFKELSHIRTARGASLFKGKIVRACVQSMLTYLWNWDMGNEGWESAVWGDLSVWWWDGCVACPWRIGSAVRFRIPSSRRWPIFRSGVV